MFFILIHHICRPYLHTSLKVTRQPKIFLDAVKLGCTYSLDWTTGLDYWSHL